MRNTDTKRLVDQFIRQMATTVRIGIEDGDFTEEEVMEHIRQHGNEMFEKVLGMSEKQFGMLMMAELLHGIAKGAIGATSGKEEDK